ncbi:ABC transporter permease [Micrococcus luteus]|uniref:ABC transporter permease n=1 Tax=Micrococcus luteus TaxID=1270 RepID=UPI0033230A66
MALPHDLQLHRRVPPRHPGDQGDRRGEAGHPGPPVLIPRTTTAARLLARGGGPFLALVPLFISWFGVEETFKVVLIAVAAASPMYAYTYLGVRGVDRKIVEAARGFGLTGFGLAFGVIIPTALPNILMALRICLSVSLTGLIAAEQIGATEGIGYLVTLAQQYYRTDYMVLCIVIYAVLGLLIDLAIRGVERAAMPWRGQVAAR